MAIEGSYLNIKGMQETHLLSQLKLGEVIEQFANLNVSFGFQAGDGNNMLEIPKSQLQAVLSKIKKPEARLNILRFLRSPDTRKRLAMLPPGTIHKVNLYKASIGQDPIKELEAHVQQDQPPQKSFALNEASKPVMDQQPAPEAGYEIGPMTKILAKIQGPDGKEQYPYRDIIEILGRRS